MKFFSTALAAFAAGSAMAAPVLDAQTVPNTVPCPCSGDKGGINVPAIPLPSPCSTTDLTQGTNAPLPNLPVPHPGQVGNGNHGSHIDNADVIVIVHTVIETVVTVEAKVKAHLDLIASIIATADIDVKALVKILVDLQVDLKVLLDCVPTLDGLLLNADVLVAADLEVILDLVVRVKALIAEVEVCLKALVVLKADVLVAIGVELQACLSLLVSIVNPIVKFALAIVANIRIHVDIVAKITACVGQITKTCDGITGLLAPVFKLIHL